MSPNSVLFRLTVLQILSSAMFIVPVAVAFYQLRGVDLAGFLMLHAFLKIAVVLGEVPTGYVADRSHRHRVIVAAQVMWLAGNGVILFAYGFAAFLVAQVFFAASNALISGTLEAYLYDYLEQAKRTDEAEAWSGRMSGAQFLSEALCGLAGAWLFSVAAYAPALAMVVAAVLAAAVAATLPDIPRLRRKAQTSVLADILSIVRWSLYDHPEIKWLMLLPALIIGATGTMFWSIQVRLMELGVTAAMAGAAIALYLAAKGFAALAVGPLVQRFKARRIVLGLIPAFALGGAMLALGADPLTVYVGGVVAAGLIHAIGHPVFAAFINRRTEPDARATVHSVRSVLQTAWGAIVMLIAGAAIKHINLSEVLLWTVAATTVLAIVPLVALWRAGSLRPAKG